MNLNQRVNMVGKKATIQVLLRILKRPKLKIFSKKSSVSRTEYQKNYKIDRFAPEKRQIFSQTVISGFETFL